MRYIYFSLGHMKFTILSEESTEFGELMGTSSAWERATPHSKKFILASILNNSEYKGLKGLAVDDCDVPKPSEPDPS